MYFREEIPENVIQQHRYQIIRWLDDREAKSEETVTLAQFCDMLMNKPGVSREDAIRVSLSILTLPTGLFNAFLLSADFFQNQLFWKILSGILSECQTVWIQIRPDILSGLIWVQTVCKDYQQRALVCKEQGDYYTGQAL